MYAMARFATRAARFAGRALRRAPRALYRPRRPRVIRRKKTANKVHSFVRWCDKDTLYPTAIQGPSSILASNSDQHFGYSFKLDNVVNPSDFTNLYDSYKINKITLILERQLNQTGTQTVSSPNNKRISVVHDYNDNNILTNEDSYLEYSNCKRYAVIGNRSISITLYPKINNGVLNAGGGVNAFTSMASNKVWLNVDDDEVPHFGLKIFIPSFVTTDGVELFKVRAKYHISLKNSK